MGDAADRSDHYASLLHTRGLPRLLLAALLGRTAGQMLGVAMVLFVLQRFHSAGLAGLTVFAYAFPGILVSPLAGALLDRSGRVLLIRLDYAVAAGTVALVVVLNATGLLSPPLLVLIAVLASVTNPLSSAGTRSLFPLLVPRRLWDRANALDSIGYQAAQVMGAPLAAIIAGLVSRPAALIATATVYACAVISLTGAGRPIPDPAAGEHRHVLREAWEGLGYVARNPTLRGLGISLSVGNVGTGLLIVGLPVVVLAHLHLNAAVVGALWALSAGTSVASALAAGRWGSHGRERRLILGGWLFSAASLAAIAVAPNLVVVALAMAVWGMAGGPMDVGMFSVRQRRTDPAWYGRAFAVSMSVNYAGSPIGSALAGPLLAAGIAAAFGAAAAFTVVGAVLTLALVPALAAASRAGAESAAVQP